MRILYLNALGKIGGAESSLLDVLASIRSATPDWELFLITGQSGPLIERAAALGVSTNVLELPEGVASLGDAGFGGPAGRRITKIAFMKRALRAAVSLPGYVYKLRKEIARLRPSIVHTNGLKMHGIGVLSCAWSVPVVWHIHDYVQRRPMMRRLLRGLTRACAAAVANSQSVAQDVREVCGPRLRVVPIYNAINLNRFQPYGSAADLDSAAGIKPAPAGTVRVGLLATFARWKGHEVFLQAIARVPASEGIRAYVIGGPLYQAAESQYSLAELRQIASNLGVEQRVGFTGLMDDPAAALRSLDIVVHASTDPEPFGLAIVEAMACGRAVVVSKSGGASEVFSDYHDAVGVTPGDPVALATAIADLAKDEKLRGRLGAAARRTAEERFDRRRLAFEMAPVYQSVLGR
jgi:glycosyltransferase involved in cell wall biosynthesis